MKQGLVWINLQIDGTRNGLSNIKETLQKICCYKCQFCTKVCDSSKAGLSSSCDGWAKCKEKVPDISDPNQNVETTRNSKLKFTELKDLFIRRVHKN